MTDPIVIMEVPTILLVSAPGPQGPVGPGVAASVTFEPTGTVASTNVQAAIVEVAAEAGTGSAVWSQGTAAPVWTIAHNLGRVPMVYVVESTGDDLEPGRADPDQNTTVLDFDGTAVSGTAYFS